MNIYRGRLMWDDFGPRFVTKHPGLGPQHDWDWDWTDIGDRMRQQPDSTKGDCGKADTSKSDGNILVALHDCNNTLPYICQKPPVDLSLEFLDICPEGFIGHRRLSYCYTISKDFATFENAKGNCTLYDKGNIVNAVTSYDRKVVGGVARTFFKQRREKTPMLVWLDDPTNQEGCIHLLYDPKSSVLAKYITASCTSLLSYMCVVPALITDRPNATVTSDNLNEKELLKYPAFTSFPLTFSLDRKRYSNDAIFIHTPNGLLISSQTFTNYENIVENEQINGEYQINVSIPIYEPTRKRRDTPQDSYDVINKRQAVNELEKTLLGTGDFRFGQEYLNILKEEPVVTDSIINSIGYYTFYFAPISAVDRFTTVKHLVRYSEKDLYIYVVYVTLLEWTINANIQMALLDYRRVDLFNLMDNPGYLYNFEEHIYGVLNNRPNITTTLEYYRGQIEFINVSTYNIKTRFFVRPNNARQMPEDFETAILSDLTNHLQSELNVNTRLMEPPVFGPSSLQVFSTVKCAFLKTTVDGKDVTLVPVKVGTRGFSEERCYPGRTALAKAMCLGGYVDGARWSEINLNESCGNLPSLNQSESTESLKTISKTKMTKDNYLEVINETLTLTDPTVNLTEADIIYTADILYKYQAFNPSNSEEELSDLYAIVNNVLNTDPENLETAQKITNAANRIIQSTDKLTNGLAVHNNQPVKTVKEFLASVVIEQPGTKMKERTIGIKLNTDSTTLQQDNIETVRKPKDVPISNIDTAIYLTRKLTEGDGTRLAFQLYSNTDLFSVDSSRFKVNSKIAAARMTKRGQNIEYLGAELVTAVFNTLEYNKNIVCAYWNYSASEDAGGWETNGCSMDSMVDGRVVCKCNHLTNFAVLIDLNANTISDTDKLVLGIITKVGLIISVICYGFSIVTFLIFKHLRKGRGQQVLVNLSVAMLCSAILFLVGVDRTENKNGCIAVAALLHYFILVTFMWMLVEGLLQYLRFVKVLGTYIPNFMRKSMIPAWGLPLIPVIVICAIDYNMYFGENGYCWLAWEPFLYGFLIPVAVIILANLIVFIMVMANLCCRRKHKGMASNQSERKMAFLHFQAGLSILVILGLSWLFGFLTVDSTRIVFHYLFAIFNAFQGCFIFLLFTFRETKIRKAWKKLFCGREKYRITTSNSDSGAKTTSTGYSSASNSRTPKHTSNNKDQKALEESLM